MLPTARELRHGALIARTEIRRSVRTLLASRSRLAAAVFFLLLSVPMGILLLGGAYAFGTQVSVGPAGASLVGSLVVPAIGGAALMFAFATVQNGPFPDHPTLPLSVTSTRAVVLGSLFTSLGAGVLWIVGPVVVLVAAFAAGARVPSLALLVAVWSVPILACAVPLGYLAGLWLIRLDRRMPIPSGLKGVVYALVIVTSVLGSQAVGYAVSERGVTAIVDEYLDAIPATDATVAYAELLFAGTGDVAVLPGATFGAGLVVLGLVSFRRSVADAADLWFGEEPESAGSGRVHRPTRPPVPFSLSASGRIGWRYLLFARRSPRRLAHLVFLAFFLFPLASTAYEDPAFLVRYAPTIGAVGCVVLTGAAFCLNPLGDECQAMPLVLLAETDAAAFVRGRIVAGLVIGAVPLLTGIAVGVAGGHLSPLPAVALLLVTVALSLAGGCVAAGLGVLVPKRDPEEVFGVETVRPSNVPLFVYELGAMAVAGVALLFLGVPEPSPGAVRSSPIGTVVYALVVLASAAAGYAFAARRLRSHTLE